MKKLIDPKQLTNFNRTDAELEALAIFSIAVASKNALTTANLIGKVLGEAKETNPRLTSCPASRWKITSASGGLDNTGGSFLPCME